MTKTRLYLVLNLLFFILYCNLGSLMETFNLHAEVILLAWIFTVLIVFFNYLILTPYRIINAILLRKNKSILKEPPVDQ
jgi:hypothetical protein